MTSAIRAERLTKYFPRTGRMGLRAFLAGLAEDERFTAVCNIGLDVPRGEVVGILGRNGAGKSTLLRLVGGVYTPDRGWVSVDGDVAALFELGGVGNVQLTGRQFAHRYLQLFGVPKSSREAVVADIHEFSELREYFDQKIHTYSAGMGARLYFAAATAIPHEVYLIDEVLSVGDEHFQAKSWSRIRDRLGKGASGLLVTHDWTAVMKLCRRSKILDGGRVLLEGSTDQVVARYLDIQPPTPGRARIVPPSPESLRAHSGEDYVLRFVVEMFCEIEAQAAIGIDVLQLGLGWEQVILADFSTVGTSPGRYEVSVRISSLPLAPGEYSLSLFLASAPDRQSGVREPLDRRAWTSGNGLTLQVLGTPVAGVVPFPICWHTVE